MYVALDGELADVAGLVAQAGLLVNVLVLTGVLGALLRLELTAHEPILALRFVINRAIVGSVPVTTIVCPASGSAAASVGFFADSVCAESASVS